MVVHEAWLSAVEISGTPSGTLKQLLELKMDLRLYRVIYKIVSTLCPGSPVPKPTKMPCLGYHNVPCYNVSCDMSGSCNPLVKTKILLGLLSWDCSGETDFLGLASVRGAKPKLGKHGIPIDYLSPDRSRRGAG